MTSVPVAERAHPSAEASRGCQPGRIEKIYFMFHPVCWAASMQNGEPPSHCDRDRWFAWLAWEQDVNQRQKTFISGMKPKEALVIFPISTTPPMLELEAHATQILGSRCFIVRRESVNPPASWAELRNPIERFLSDDRLEGKADFLEGVPAEIRAELSAEIREACAALGYDWSPAALKVVYYSRLVAMDLEQAFAERGLSYDRGTVESEAFGEGFEQCAMTWKAMLVPYLGLGKPAENNFELSVSGAPYPHKARLRERVRLGPEVRLFLWESRDGSPIGLYARAWCRLRDPQVYARLPVEGASLEVWDVAAKCWPAEESPLEASGGHLKVPVLNAIRRDPGDKPCYMIGNDISFDEFRQRLVTARIED